MYVIELRGIVALYRFQFVIRTLICGKKQAHAA